MNDPLAACLLYSRDPALAQRLRGALTGETDVRVAASAPDLLDLCARHAPVFVWLDLFVPDAGRVLARLLEEPSACIVVALGLPGSDPAFESAQAGAWAVEDRGLAHDRALAVWRQGMKHVTLLAASLRREDPAARPASPTPPARADEPLSHYARAVRHLGNVDAMLESLIDIVTSSVAVTRVGVFAKERGGNSYRLRAARCCLEDTRRLAVADDDFLVRWMQRHAHPISRLALGHVTDTGAADRLRRTLAAMGAEAIVPLHGRGGLLGWLFAGDRLTGAPLNEADLAELARAAGHVSAALETALLHEEVALQKTLAETLLDSMPLGIVAVNENGVIRWFNAAAVRLLGVRAEDALNAPVMKLGGRRADMLLRALRDDGSREQTAEWDDPTTGVPLRVTARRVETAGRCVGAMLTVRDLRDERALQEKQRRVERAHFWTELAAAISHEVKNPLVAIRTLAQLLPDQYEDPEFRSQFATLALQEVDRLNRLVNQINAFANPPEPSFAALDVGLVVKEAVVEARRRVNANGIAVEVALPENLPAVRGDRAALVDAFAHLIANGLEILQDAGNPRLRISATHPEPGAGAQTVRIRVEDNGRGFAPDIRDQAFSPFCTKKARGIGLGLPIVKRTVTDHGGEVTIDTGDNGTAITVSLPAAVKEVKQHEEAYSGR